MISINNWIEQQIQIQRDTILESIYPDFLPQPKDLCEHLKHNLDRCDDVQFDYDLNDTDIQDIVYDWLYMNYDSNLHLTNGFWLSDDELHLFNIEEHELSLEQFRLTEHRKKVISRYTDLYIPDYTNEYGYIVDHKMVVVRYDIQDIIEHIEDNIR